MRKDFRNHDKKIMGKLNLFVKFKAMVKNK